MLLSGVLEDVGTVLGQSRYRLLDPDELALAAEVRAKTDPDALFITGMENQDPIAMLTGRRIYVGYANWLWTEGIPYEGRRAEVLAIYQNAPGSEARLAAARHRLRRDRPARARDPRGGRGGVRAPAIRC